MIKYEGYIIDYEQGVLFTNGEWTAAQRRFFNCKEIVKKFNDGLNEDLVHSTFMCDDVKEGEHLPIQVVKHD
jgi:hypothetical protein